MNTEDVKKEEVKEVAVTEKTQAELMDMAMEMGFPFVE